MTEGTSLASLTRALSEEFTRHMIRIYVRGSISERVPWQHCSETYSACSADSLVQQMLALLIWTQYSAAGRDSFRLAEEPWLVC